MSLMAVFIFLPLVILLCLVIAQIILRSVTWVLDWQILRYQRAGVSTLNDDQRWTLAEKICGRQDVEDLIETVGQLTKSALIGSVVWYSAGMAGILLTLFLAK